MENAHHKSPGEFKILDGQKTDVNQIFANLGYIVSKALELFKKDPANFILAFAIPVVVGGLLSVILVPMLLGGIIAGGGLIGGVISLVVYIFCGIVLSVVAYVALLKAIIDVSKGGKINIVELFRFGFTHCVNYIVLAFKMLFTIFSGIKPFVNAWLAPIYFVENGGNVEQSIKSSQTTAEGKTVTLVWTVILLGIGASIVSSILAQVWVGVFWRIYFDLATLGVYVINGVVTPFVIMGQFVLREELAKQGGHHAPAHTEHHAA